MEIKDFKKIKKSRVFYVDKIIKQKGYCEDIMCECCPFSRENMLKGTCYAHGNMSLKKFKQMLNDFVNLNDKTKEACEACSTEHYEKYTDMKEFDF